MHLLLPGLDWLRLSRLQIAGFGSELDVSFLNCLNDSHTHNPVGHHCIEHEAAYSVWISRRVL